MNYTVKQYALIERLYAGVLYDDLSSEDQEVLYYLHDEKLAVPDADNCWKLTQRGERVHCEHQRQQQLSVNKASKQSEEKAQKKKQYAFEIFLVLLSALVTNIDRIIRWIVSLF